MPAYKGIHSHLPVHYNRCLFSNTFCILDYMNYLFLTRHVMQSTQVILLRFESTDCNSKVSIFTYWIGVSWNRDYLVQNPVAIWLQKHLNTYDWDITQTWDIQIDDITEPFILHPIEDIRSTDNSELIPEAIQPGEASTSATTLVSIWNTQVFQTALTALVSSLIVWRRIRFNPLPKRRVALHVTLAAAILPCLILLQTGQVVYYDRRSWVRLSLLCVPNVERYTHHRNNKFVTIFPGVEVMQ